MVMSGASKSIFDELMLLSECQYLSDLPQPHSRDAVREAAHKLEEDTYSVGEWNQLVSYISGERCEYENSCEAKNALIENLHTGNE